MKPSGTPAILGLAILCLVKASVQPSLGAPKRTPPFAEVAVVPLTVVPQPMPRASAQKDQDDLVQRLAEKATVRAIRSLLRRGIAEAVRAASPKDSSAEQLLVTGTVRLPVPLPSHLVGLSAQLRRGRLATVNVAIRRADGTTVARAGAMLDWSDVLWTYGGRVQHPRPQEAVLEEAVQEVVDRAIKRLKQSGVEEAPEVDDPDDKPRVAIRGRRLALQPCREIGNDSGESWRYS